MKRFVLPVFVVFILIAFFSFSVSAAGEPFYVFDLSNLDAINFQYTTQNHIGLSTTEAYNPMGFMAFTVEGSNSNRVSGINGFFSFDIAANSGATRVFLQSGITYTFELYAWNVYYVNEGESSQKGNFIDLFTLTLQNPQGDSVLVHLTESMFSSEYVQYIPQISQGAYLMKFSIDGSLYPGFEVVTMKAHSLYSSSPSDGVSKYIQAFYDFNISAVNSSDKHWEQDITGIAPPGSDQANNNHIQEQDILNSISGSVSDSNNLFSNAIGLWSDWVGSIALVTRIFNSFTDVSVISVLLVISLSFGISAFLFSLGSSFARHESSKNKGGRK